MGKTTYRKLTDNEIAALKANGCSARGWGDVEVAQGFTPDEIRNCRFLGTVRLGENVRIDGVCEIHHYEIGDNAMISHTESLVSTYKSTFGNGVRVSVLNESGGREVPIYTGLTAQTAYVTAMYRHRPEIIQAIEKQIDAEIRRHTPALGRIGAGTTIAHCGALTDICTGENAVLQGVAELTNGTIHSTADSPSFIGRGVVARDFIVSDSAEVSDFVHLEKCFVGQGCRLGKGFTAQNSLFFANCVCEQGEACAAFAGPYTVTHHKSTLLIGGLFSFYNAGSHTNQSNHMYRLGPMHQGVLERGCKTGSDSYILFPARIGAFSIVKGRHYGNPDTSALPFSCLIEEAGKTVVLPGVNLKSIGLARDLLKWPERDLRKGEKNDRIAFEGLNPCVIEQVLSGLKLLGQLDASDDAFYNGVVVPAARIERGRDIYRTAIDWYLGNAAVKHLKIGKNLVYSGKNRRLWSDLSGLVAPQAEIERILERLPSMPSLREWEDAISGLHARYNEWEWDYAVSLAEEMHGKPAGALTCADWTAIVRRGISAADTILRWQKENAAKEYAEKMRTGYGLDGGPEQRDAEFAIVHGTPETHAFVERLCREHQTKTEEAQRLLRRLEAQK